MTDSIKTAELSADRWHRDKPARIEQLAKRWHLELDAPFTDGSTGSWVAPCTSRYGPSVLKIGFPHFEAEYEIDGLALWDGRGAVKLYEFDRDLNALLIERCEPGRSLRHETADKQDQVVCELLTKLWQPCPTTAVRSLSNMVRYWCHSARIRFADDDVDHTLVNAGLETLEELASDANPEQLLVTDLHAGNVLSSAREPWLMIDPKPHVGDPCYDLTQHLLNNKSRLAEEGVRTIERIARLAGVEPHRVMRWTFGRLCLDSENHALAQLLLRQL